MESPTPWHVGGIGGCRPKLVYDASGRTIMRSWGNGSDEENEANVQLAAQAPKLREQVRILRKALEELRTRVREMPCGHSVHDANEEPTESGWYECWATDDRWSGEMRYRAWGNGLWWIPLSDGWIPAPAQDGIYSWRGPVADVNGPAPDETNPDALRSGEAGTKNGAST